MHIIQRKETAKALLTLGLLVGTHIASAQFLPQFTVGKGSGAFQVKRPTCDYEAGFASRAYPYGSEITVGANDEIYVFLSNGRQIHFGKDTVFVLMNDPEKEGAKRIVLKSGSLETFLANEDDMVYPLSVETAAAFYDDFDGRVSILANAEGTVSTVRVGIGKVTFRAPQLLSSRVGTGVVVSVRTKADGSYTEVHGEAGDCVLTFEHGSEAPFEAAFHSGSCMKIWRRKAPVTGTLAVSMMLANPDSSVANSYAFLEGQAPIQNGVPEKATAAATEEAATEEVADAGLDALDDFSSDFSSDFDAVEPAAESAPAAAAPVQDDFSSFDSFNF